MELGSNEPRRFYVRPDKILDTLGASFQLLTRLGSGAFVEGYSVKVEKEEPGDEAQYAVLRGMGYKVVESTTKLNDRAQPRKPIELYEFQGCPFCAKVREAVNILDLDVMFFPCPQGSPTYRPKVVAEGGRSMFPYMKDPNSGVSMYESDDIIAYLFDKYGEGSDVPLSLKLGPLTVLSAGVGMIPRALKGSRYTPAKMPAKPLELWGYEASPYTRTVREKLCELELPHKFITCARGSPKRQLLKDLGGAGQTPYLVDPNTKISGYESADIIDYLEKTYMKGGEAALAA